MKLSNPELLSHYLAKRDLTQAQLGRRCGMSRQMIWSLIHNKKASCTADKATRIELALDLLPGTLFHPDELDQTLNAAKAKAGAAV